MCPVRHSLFLRKKLPPLQSSVCSGPTQCELQCGNPIYFDALHIEQRMNVYFGCIYCYCYLKELIERIIIAIIHSGNNFYCNMTMTTDISTIPNYGGCILKYPVYYWWVIRMQNSYWLQLHREFSTCNFKTPMWVFVRHLY